MLQCNFIAVGAPPIGLVHRAQVDAGIHRVTRSVNLVPATGGTTLTLGAESGQGSIGKSVRARTVLCQWTWDASSTFLRLVFKLSLFAEQFHYGLHFIQPIEQ